MGIQAVGLGLGTLCAQSQYADIVVGHDYRAYSQAIKYALICGLMASGMHVHDIGLALSPTAYFMQDTLTHTTGRKCAVAMVTASHNENGWTGLKMGTAFPLTFGPDEMDTLKTIVLTNTSRTKDGGKMSYHTNSAEAYKTNLATRPLITRPLKAVVACGNGTASAFAPDILTRLGIDVIPLHCTLDYQFPHHNPNPEDMKMLDALGKTVRAEKADIGFAFDGDGDRCGFVDENGIEIFADKIGVILARELAKQHKNPHFIADVKSTGLFASDPELIKTGATTEYWKTGHSHMKRRVFESNALAGFEKSGHFFFAPPLGRGVDDGILTAITICDILEHNPKKSIAEFYAALPITFSSPTMSPYCSDNIKYRIVENIAEHIENMKKSNTTILGQKITNITRVNGIRIQIEDGSWGLIRASSNKPGLVVVTESSTSKTQMHNMFYALDDILKQYPEIGEYDQKLTSRA